MRLIELEPTPYLFNGLGAGFYFWCPHCRTTRLSVKRIVISVHDQMMTFLDIFGPGHANIVPCKADECWVITGTSWDDVSVTPSLDASQSGHWHGHITNGQIQ